MTISPAFSQNTDHKDQEVVDLWPGAAPGTEHKTSDEIDTHTDLPVGRVHVKTNVNVPTFTVFRPAPGKATGAAVVVLPGGGFGGLAWDLEGLEPCRWLTERGITAFLLKYRVGHLALAPGEAPPKDWGQIMRLMEPGRRIAVADATQAMKLIRAGASQYGIDADRVGMMGFSAGAATTLGVVLEADASARPNFAAPIYGMPMIDTAPAADAPALFIAHAQDDPTVPAEQSARLLEQWQKVKRPAELHIYAKGGHGFGMRSQGIPVDLWPSAFEAWLKSQGLLENAKPHGA